LKAIKIPEDIDYGQIGGLSKEIQQNLRPFSLSPWAGASGFQGHASGDFDLVVHLKKLSFQRRRAAKSRRADDGKGKFVRKTIELSGFFFFSPSSFSFYLWKIFPFRCPRLSGFSWLDFRCGYRRLFLVVCA